MIILGIETSCDETALAILEVMREENGAASVKILANVVASQIELHRKYGGVFPMLAKREHGKNLIPLFKKLLAEVYHSTLSPASIATPTQTTKNPKKIYSSIPKNIGIDLEREPELLKAFTEFIPTIKKPQIDRIAVTFGPGLEPALWVGLNFAKALATIWNIPLIPVNHMEGHVLVSLLQRNEENQKSEARNSKEILIHNSSFIIRLPNFPALALLISGGHTELVLVKENFQYEIVGETRDDAVGEAFDKVARILGLPYPGGPEISRLAEARRIRKPAPPRPFTLPRPMLHSGNLDFSFSGIKTAVLYSVKKLPGLSDDNREAFALEFENAVTEVLITKVKSAMEKFAVKTLILGGGVIANAHIRREFEKLAKAEGEISLFVPQIDHATDNAIMIALAGYFNAEKVNRGGVNNLKAKGGSRVDEVYPHIN